MAESLPSENGLPRRTALFWLTLVALLAAGLRLWGLGYGLPHPASRPDEERVVGAALSIARGVSLHPGDLMYPGLMKYVAASVIAARFRIGYALGWYENFDDFVRDLMVARPGSHYLICRAVSAGFGVLTVLATYALAVRLSGTRWGGLLAAWLLAVCYLHARDSRFATVDVTATFFATLCLHFTAGLASAGRTRDLVLAALSAGLAAASKYNVGLVWVAVALACPLAPGGGSWRVTLRRLGLAGVLGLMGFAIAAPYSVLRYKATLRTLAGVSAALRGGSGPLALGVHLRHSLPEGMGWPFFMAALFGLLYAGWRRQPGHLALLAFAATFFASIAHLHWVVPRYVIPLLPVLAALAASAVVASVGRARGLAVTILALLLGGPSLYKTVLFDRLASRRDSRLEAAEWVQRNLPAGTPIAVCEGYGAPAINRDPERGPAFRVRRFECSTENLAAIDRPYLVTHEHPRLPWSFPLGSFDGVLGSHWRKREVFDPFAGGSGGSAYYYEGDAFYLPYSGLDTVTRGGPVVSVWERQPSPVERASPVASAPRGAERPLLTEPPLRRHLPSTVPPSPGEPIRP